MTVLGDVSSSNIFANVGQVVVNVLLVCGVDNGVSLNDVIQVGLNLTIRTFLFHESLKYRVHWNSESSADVSSLLVGDSEVGDSELKVLGVITKGGERRASKEVNDRGNAVGSVIAAN